jgi:hypothetical protein
MQICIKTGFQHATKAHVYVIRAPKRSHWFTKPNSKKKSALFAASLYLHSTFQ